MLIPLFSIVLSTLSNIVISTICFVYLVCALHFHFCLIIGILQGIFYGLGNGGGTILSGYLYELLGPQKTFHYFAISSLALLLFLLISYPLFKRDCISKDKHDEYQPIPADEGNEEDLQNAEKESQSEN